MTSWKTSAIVVLTAGLALLAALPACAGPPQPGSVILPNLPPDYDWWNGCAPTAAAMLFAWWGQQGYGAFPGNYPAPPATYAVTSSDPADYNDARGVIASWAHKQAGLSRGLTYGSYRNHAPDSIADFILTYNSETNAGGLAHGFLTFGAWDDPRTPQIESRRFTASTYYTSDDWTYDNYVAEINAGRPVFLGWSSATLGHATLGVGYNNTGGKHDVIVLTTWHQGSQEWQWTNETSSGYNLSVDSGVTLQRPSGVTPRLSAYFSTSRGYIGDMRVELGVGDPAAPQWSTVAWVPDSANQDHNLILTDIDCTPELAAFRTSNLNWYLKVTSDYPQYPGTIQDFQIRYGFDQHVFHYAGGPVAIVGGGGPSYVYLQTNPFAISSTWQGAGTAPASWGSDAAWDQGSPQYVGDTATFGNAIGSTSVAVVTLDGNRTISGLTFNNTLGGGYQIAQGTAGSLILDNGTNAATVTVAAGSHSIAAPVVLNSDVTVSTALGTALSISGPISGSKSLTKNGTGTLTLAAAPAYSGNTTVNAGTLTYAVDSGTPTIGPDALLTIAAGATVNVGGNADPFSNGAQLVSIRNDSSAAGLNITAGSHAIGDLSGPGKTTLADGTSLTADRIDQDTLVVGTGASVILRSTASRPGLGQPAVGTDGASQVPEPGTAALLGPVVLATLIWWRLRRRRQIGSRDSGSGRAEPER